MKKIKYSDYRNPRNTAQYLIGRSLHVETPGIIGFQYYLEELEAVKNKITMPTIEELSQLLRAQREAAVAEGRGQFAALREENPAPRSARRLSFSN